MSGSNFSTTAHVEMVAEERALRQLRDDVEDRLSDIQVGVGAGDEGGGRPPEMRSDGGGQSGRQRRREKREHRWARSRTDDIEDLLEAVRGLDMGRWRRWAGYSGEGTRVSVAILAVLSPEHSRALSGVLSGRRSATKSAAQAAIPR